MSSVENAALRTRGGVVVHRRCETEAGLEPGRVAVESLVEALDARRGVLLASTCEVPGRYARWDRGFVDPPVAVECRGRQVTLEALGARGAVLLPALVRAAESAPGARLTERETTRARLEVAPAAGRFTEEDRSRQPSVFGVLRALADLFATPDDPELGLYGAFGYDLAFQFDAVPLRHPRPTGQRDLVLYLPDEITVVDHRRETCQRLRYEFEVDGCSTRGLPRDGERRAYRAGRLSRGSDHEPGEYAQVVRRARCAFARGDLFEVVPSQVFSEGCPDPPSEVFRRLRARNPAPYGFLVNLGRNEYLVGASPEMYVRVGDPDVRPGSGLERRVETAPIAGTIARGLDPIEDADRIDVLLRSEKDRAELTMCTDVDRNDKSRVCEPESVRVTGRRQIELYSTLIHTVDHVEGVLAEGFDALDAFLTHTWAVTVTGAPKNEAMRFIESHELSPRRWYGGAVGRIGFDGRLDTGLVLRTIRIADGVAETRVGATLLHDSDPDREEAETRLKAAALLDAIRRPDAPAPPVRVREPAGIGRRVLLVDARDSFVHTLAGYFRRTGARVKTLRAGFPRGDLRRTEPDLLVLSPGPGRPEDFGLAGLVAAAAELELPVFGVCLGLQAIAESFGAELGVLPEPVHGKASRIRVLGGRVFEGLPPCFSVGRYHSLYVDAESLPGSLRVTAEDEAGLIMALEHRELPVSGVQFHPESILTGADQLGFRIVENVVRATPVRPRIRVARDFFGA